MQTFTGLQYLKIDIANNFGLDKEDWNDRLDWFEQEKNNLENIIKSAEEPALFYAGVQAYRKTQRGEPSSYPVSLDATASGIQILSCLTSCRKSALVCNVLDAGKRMDAYTALYMAMLSRVGESTKIDREVVKYAIMTSYYQSRAVPKKVFGEGQMLANFYKTLEEETPGAWNLNLAIASLWDPEALSNDWVLPDGFNVRIKVMDKISEIVHYLDEPFEVYRKANMPKKMDRSLGANTTHSVDGMVVRELVRRCSHNEVTIYRVKDTIHSRRTSTTRPKDKKVMELWDHYQKSGFLSARTLSYLDEENSGHVDPDIILDMINTFPKKPFEVLTVHDCFRVLPNYGNDLRKQYNQILSDIAGSNLLQYMVRQISGDMTITVNKYDDIAAEILDTNYALS